MLRVWPGSRCTHCGCKYPSFADSLPARLTAQQRQRRLQGSVAAATAPPDVSRQAEPAKRTQKKPHRRRPGPTPGRPQLSRRQEKRAATDLPVRIGKVIAGASLASRRGAEELIAQGRVSLNGKPVTQPGTLVQPAVDKVRVDGKPVARTTLRHYFMLNKPKGYLCANRAPGSASTRLVVDLFQEWVESQVRDRPHAVPPRLFTVGRLDVQSTGLILVTNDGDWAHEVQHPSKGLTKEYIVSVEQAPTRAQIEAMAAGCVVDGMMVRPVGVGPAAGDASQRSRLRVIISEGRNREVRRLAEAAGLSVTALKRARVGGLRLPRDLAIGEYRSLSPHEIRRVTDRGFQNNPNATT